MHTQMLKVFPIPRVELDPRKGTPENYLVRNYRFI
jgi:hypothetical protein